jgi:signal transduction histidine kinase
MEFVAVLLAIALGAALWQWRRAQRRCDELAARHAQIEQRLAQSAQQRHELLANVSHDLRTPLASMQGYLELLLVRHGSLDAAEERNYLQTAARQCGRLARLVADLFDLTRLDAGELVAQPEDFGLGELVQDAVQQHAADAGARGVRLDAVGTQQAAAVRADMALVARLLDQLLDNALRHTPAGGSVTLRVERCGDRIAVCVCDTGGGIALDDLPGVFDRYDSASRRPGGAADGRAGLGLAISQRIARLHGCELAILSRPAEGTQVSFDLPVAAAARLVA